MTVGYTEARVRYPSACGKHTLVGLMTAPADAEAPNAGKVVVLVHGGMANKNSFYHKHIASQLSAQLGYRTFRFDHVSSGESEPIYKEGPDEQYRNMMGGFWEDVDDLRATVEYLQSPACSSSSLQVDCIIGHSRGGQIAHMFAVMHAKRLGVARIVGVHMRYDLEFWRSTRQKNVAASGNWVLTWKNRGKLVKHTVSPGDVDTYAAVPMQDISTLDPGIDVLNVYGITGSQTSQATYDTGYQMLTDGVVPFSDVEGPANLVPRHTVKFLSGVGHYYREDGASEKLWRVLAEWLQRSTRSKL